MPEVLLNGVSRHFGAVKAVDDLSLHIADNEFVTLLGPSGCGKTTTLRMVAGLEQNDEGKISIGDRVVSDSSKRLFVAPDKREIGMVFQSYAIWPHLTVFENVAYPLRVRGVPKEEIEKKVGNALRLVEMESFSQRPAPLLSGGQQQRVAIARALAFEPQVLLLDEPLSNLDSKLRTTMGDEFRALQRRLRITTLYVTHDQDEAMALSDRIVVMHGGKILQAGAPEEIYQRPSSVQVAAFFGSPNLIQGTVRSAEQLKANTHRLQIEGKGWRGACLSAQAVPSGSTVTVVARPEDLEIVKPENAPVVDSLQWSGRVVDSIFRGPRRTVSVDCAGLRLTVEAPAMRAAGVGENVILVLRADDAWAIPS